jgi:prolyl-tRNA synthetase
MSSSFVRTLREDPADAEVPSHRLLVRAGYVRRVAAGIYTLLPLGVRVLANVAGVVREEMDRIGAQEVLFPALLPREPYDRTGRTVAYGELLFRIRDRRGADYVLGPTHEEMFTLLAAAELTSYRDVPLALFQIQTKYRDEARPRSGLLRGREFSMKDSYSFDLDDDGLRKSYQAHREAYQRILRRLGIDYRIVAAVSGAMGGSVSEEFLAPTPVGEDTFVLCGQCEYAANVEAVPAVVASVPPVDHPPIEVLDTPDTPTIETLAARLGVPPSATLKNLLVWADDEIVAVGVPGDRDVDLRRLEEALAPARVRIVEAGDFAARPDLVRGYVGPQGMAGRAFRYLADPRVAAGTAWVTGANEVDRHARNVVCGRDFAVDQYADVAAVLPGDPCPRCAGPLVIDRGVEVGHVFQLGRVYADTFGLDVAGPDGAPVRVTMGCYGLGLTRAIAVVAEQHHDERGLAWPPEVAPYDVHLVPVGRGDQLAQALDLADRLDAAGLRVLVDDRTDASTGVKLTDAELLGMPWIVVVGRRAAEGVVEVRDRHRGSTEEVRLDGVVRAIAAGRAAPAPRPGRDGGIPLVDRQ